MVAALIQFKERHGHCNVPYEWPENVELAKWLHSVRGNRRQGRLNSQRVQQLEKLGVVWEPMKERWQQMFAALVAYKRHHGDCKVPDGWSENSKLAGWVRSLRARRKKNTLGPDLIRQLDRIGFIWDWPYEHWEENYALLVQYRKKFGNCRVSTLSKQHGKLAQWVRVQRKKQKCGELSEAHFRRLEKLGFIWDVVEEQWEEMFGALVEFERTHGHCDVPWSWPENPKLGHWVSTQRAFYKRGKLDSKRIRRLSKLGFRWRVARQAAKQVAKPKEDPRRRLPRCKGPARTQNPAAKEDAKPA
jgi:hypothetical protein